MIFATDLDRTMIFSEKFLNDKNKDLVVGYQDGKIKSYMTCKAEKILNELKVKITVIPCTTRSREQFERIPYFQNCKYIVCANGAIILRNGQEDPQWKMVMQENLFMCIKELKEYKEQLEQKNFVTENKVSIVDGYFLFFKVKSNLKMKCQEYLETLLNKKKFYYSISGKKVYIFPSFISKENALKYLIDKIGDNSVIVAGDSELDFGMINLATKRAFIPVYEVKNFDNKMKNITFIHDSGIFSGELILEEVKNIVEKEEHVDVN